MIFLFQVLSDAILHEATERSRSQEGHISNQVRIENFTVIFDRIRLFKFDARTCDFCRCRQYFADSYWAHPVWLSRPAVEAAAVGIAAGGIRDQCALISSSHEAGLGTFLWMYGVACAGMSGFMYSSRGRLEHASLAVVHRARPQMNTNPPPFNKSATPLDQVQPHVLKMHQVDSFVL